MKRLWNNLKLAVALVFNRYEAVTSRWGERSWLNQPLQDGKLDINAATRKELQRSHSFWVANSSIVYKIKSLKVQFSVGVEGLNVTPNSINEDWNVSRQASWDRWCRQPEINSRLNMGQVTIQWAGCFFDYGEVFIHKIDPRNSPDGKPKIETIDPIRVETPHKKQKEEGKTIFDGIEVDASGMPRIYWVKSASDKDSYQPIPAAEMIHKFKARRIGQMRGIPDGHACLNELHDYQDLQKYEMQAAKEVSRIAAVETNATGELDVAGTRRARINVSSANQSGQIVTKSADSFYKVSTGAGTIAMRAGDSIKNFQIDRPSVSQQMHWDIILNNICCGYNVPKLLVVPYTLQGTVTRADLDICASAFRFDFELLADALRDVYEWQNRWAVDYDRTMDGKAPDDCLECIIRPPRSPNVDIGYTAQALQLELQMGTKTFPDVCAERQLSWHQQLKQNAEYVFYKKKLAKEFSSREPGIEVLPDEISQIIEPPAPDTEPDGDDVPIKGKDTAPAAATA